MVGLKDLLEMPLVLRQCRLASGRAQMTKEPFVSETASTELGKSAAALVWDKLSALNGRGDFTPYPSDSLLKVFGLAALPSLRCPRWHPEQSGSRSFMERGVDS